MRIIPAPYTVEGCIGLVASLLENQSVDEKSSVLHSETFQVGPGYNRDQGIEPALGDVGGQCRVQLCHRQTGTVLHTIIVPPCWTVQEVFSYILSISDRELDSVYNNTGPLI